jgi:hypothetical protein
MQSEFQNAYRVSQQTTDYDPHADAIGLIQRGGRFAVVCLSPAYCRFTDALLPGPVRTLVRNPDGRALAFQTEGAARAAIRELFAADPDGDASYDVVMPSSDPACWRGAVTGFVSEMVSQDPEDARSWCARHRDALLAMHASGVPPAVAAAEILRLHDGHFDYVAWKAANQPDAEQRREPGLPGTLPF